MTLTLSYTTLAELADDARNHTALPQNVYHFVGTLVTHRPANQKLWPGGVILTVNRSMREPVELLYERFNGQYLHVHTLGE